MLVKEPNANIGYVLGESLMPNTIYSPTFLLKISLFR